MVQNDRKIMQEILQQYYLGNYRSVIDNITEHLSGQILNLEVK
jgi:hypothetical protein